MSGRSGATAGTGFATPADLAKIKKRREADVLSAILKYLSVRPGVTAWRANSRVVAVEDHGRKRLIRFGVKGQPDILGWVRDKLWIPGFSRSFVIARPLGIEVKASGGKTTLAQCSFLDRLRDDGGIAIVAWSVDDVVSGLDAAAFARLGLANGGLAGARLSVREALAERGPE